MQARAQQQLLTGVRQVRVQGLGFTLSLVISPRAVLDLNMRGQYGVYFVVRQ
jgi:hypothetical protein